MAIAIGEVPRGFGPGTSGDKSNSVLIPLPPQNGGAFGWGQVFLSFGVDHGDAKLRVAVWNDASRSWRVETIDVKSAGGRVNVWIRDGDSKVSVSRYQASPADDGRQPVGWMLETVLKA